MDLKLGRCILVVGVGLAAYAALLRQEKLRIQHRTKNHAVAMFDSLPALANSLVESERVSGNWKLRTASVTRLAVARGSIEDVCALYSSRLKSARWSGGIASTTCESLDSGLYRLFAWLPSLTGSELYNFQLFAQGTDRASWEGIWMGGSEAAAHFRHALGSGYPTLLTLSVTYYEDFDLRDSPCASWEDSGCEDGEWESKR